MTLMRAFLGLLLGLTLAVAPAAAQLTLTGTGTYSTGGGYTAEATALFARMSVQPDPTRKGLINAYIVCEKGGAGSINGTDLWSGWLVFDVFAAHDAQAALLNWKGTSFTPTAVNSPTWTTDSGFLGNGTAGTGASAGGVDKYVNLNFTPSTDGGTTYQTNAATLSYISATNTQDGTWRDIGQFATGSGLTTVMNAHGGSGLRGILNEAAGFNNFGVAGDNAAGLFTFAVVSNTSLNAYRNATILAIVVTPRTGRADQSLTVLGDVSVAGTTPRFSGRRIPGVWAGATLNANGVADHFACSQPYFTAIGAPITP